MLQCGRKLSQHTARIYCHNKALKCHKDTCHNVAKNCHNLPSEFTVCEICGKNVAFLFSSHIG